MNRAGYRKWQAQAPPTAWTKIVAAGGIPCATTCKSLEELTTLYDRPLLALFEAVLEGDRQRAEDWKQDFLVSHFLSGRVFRSARPQARFRTYLAVAVRNYVINRRAAESAHKRSPDAARPFSQLESDQDSRSFAENLADADAGVLEVHLTRARAWDLYHAALDQLENWCRSQHDAYDLLRVPQRLREGASTISELQKTHPQARPAISEFKSILRHLVREELLMEPGQDEGMIIGREIAVFLDAVRSPLPGGGHP